MTTESTATSKLRSVPVASSDEDVVARIRRGEPTLFEVLMRRHNQRAYRVARALLRDDLEAEEVVQQAWVSAWQHLADFRGAARFSTWLLRIVVNEVMMRARVSGRQISLDDPEVEEPAMPSSKPSPYDTAELKELVGFVERAVDTLPDAYRSVFIMRDIEGMSTADTAQSLALSDDVVKVRLHRARARLRDDLMAQVGQTAAAVFTFGSTRCDRTVEKVMRVVLQALKGSH